ncbi:YdcF family protein [Oscillatoria salina]|uniref:YdcF family protein n=1 Tax=Oscillatoria salina TaxID=331517 RepID=UPI001CCC9D4F|nr:YdcF family protein [Oscillatoria salina]MBZ8181976.1 YdcF family protein [Oscillatoria salina IIICB1]
MFLLITRILLWLLIGILLYNLLVRLIPRRWLAIVGAILLLSIIIVGFIDPNTPVVLPAWSLLSVLFRPLGLAIFLLFLGAIRIKKGGISKPGPGLIWAAFIILLFSSLPVVAYSLAQAAEQEAIRVEQLRTEICEVECPVPLTPFGAQDAGAIVLLAQGTTEPYLPYRTQIQLTDRGSLLLYTAQLYQEGSAPLVIVSAGPRANLEGPAERRIEANDVADLLERFGVPRNRIEIEPTGVDLRTSAIQVREILTQRGLADEPVILVTSAINVRRATLTFANAGLEVVPRPTDFYTFQPLATPRRRLDFVDFLPSVQALTVTTRVIDEYLASVYYFLRGWLSLPVV